VPGTVYLSRAQDQPAAAEPLDELLRLPLRAMVFGGAAARPQRRYKEEARHGRALRLLQQAPGSFDVDLLEGDRGRFLRHDPGDVEERVASFPGAVHAPCIR